jgi:hypothetical protein
VLELNNQWPVTESAGMQTEAAIRQNKDICVKITRSKEKRNQLMLFTFKGDF